jgi:betaine-aldehyde dehydrogenase
MVSVTGSVRAGMEVAAAASKSLKRVHLELGGKAPVVVFNDADLQAAAEGIAIAGFFNSGQDCTAATRVLVQEGVYDEMVKLLADQATNQIGMGAPDEDVIVGPVNNASQFERVSGFISRTPSHARIVAGGAPANRPGYFVPPTVIADLKQSDELIQSEIFGPVITIQKFKDEAEAVAMSNGVDYGLASSVWTKDARCVCRRPLTSAASGSIPTSQSLPKCHMAVSSEADTARISQTTALRITPVSSTS